MKFWKETIKPIFVEIVAALIVGSIALVVVALAVKLATILFS